MPPPEPHPLPLFGLSPLLQALAAVLLCQLIGEVVSRGAGLPVPGPVLGMGLMLAALAASPALRARIRPVAGTILGNLMLLFVPATVGAVMQLPRLGSAALPLTLAAVTSTLLAILVTVGVFTLTTRLLSDRSPEAGKERGK